jgi:hypothetical protein
MNATSKKTRIITRSRYSARIYRGKENGERRMSGWQPGGRVSQAG